MSLLRVLTAARCVQRHALPLALTAAVRHPSDRSVHASAPNNRSIVEILKDDHKRVKGLFERFNNEVGTNAAAHQEKIAQEIVIELSRHDWLEREFLYPAVKQHNINLQQHCLDAHEEVTKDLVQLHSMRDVDVRNNAKSLDELKRLIGRIYTEFEAHVQEEEGDVFPICHAKMSAAQLDDLGNRLTAARDVAPTRPHTSTPREPPGSTVMGRAAGMVDRAIDRLEHRT